MQRQHLILLIGLSLPVALVAFTAQGCGPAVDTTTGTGGAGGGVDGGPTTTTTSSGILPDSGLHDAFPDYVDPGCPDAGPPHKHFTCDPYHQNNGDCTDGEGCFITVSYPSEPCGEETYGSLCAPVGVGGQGDECSGPSDCGAGFVCVVSGAGDQCVKLCHLQGVDDCDNGLVCEPIDVEGFGGCL